MIQNFLIKIKPTITLSDGRGKGERRRVMEFVGFVFEEKHI